MIFGKIGNMAVSVVVFAITYSVFGYALSSLSSLSQYSNSAAASLVFQSGVYIVLAAFFINGGVSILRYFKINLLPKYDVNEISYDIVNLGLTFSIISVLLLMFSGLDLIIGLLMLVVSAFLIFAVIGRFYKHITGTELMRTGAF